MYLKVVLPIFQTKRRNLSSSIRTLCEIKVFLELLGDNNQSITLLIDTMQPRSKCKSSDDSYFNFFNGNSQFHLQMQLALINHLVPLVTKRLDKKRKTVS